MKREDGDGDEQEKEKKSKFHQEVLDIIIIIVLTISVRFSRCWVGSVGKLREEVAHAVLDTETIEKLFG
jgi:hypothetical protein